MARMIGRGGVVLLLVGSMAVLTGCAALVVGAAAGAGGYAYVRGELARVYDAPFEKVWTASVDSLKALQMSITDTNKDQLKGTVKAKRADDTSVKVSVKSLAANSTQVKVRVGVFGDRAASERIHEEIAARL